MTAAGPSPRPEEGAHRVSWFERRLTVLLLVVTVFVLGLATPGALRAQLAQGHVYIFSTRFFADLPRRLTGPGRFRFLVQPAVSMLLGWRDGLADARAGRLPYFMAILGRKGDWRQLAAHGLAVLGNVLLMGILLDAVAQWLILGVSYPGVAVIVGPVLIGFPYTLARGLTNRLSRRNAPMP